MSIGNQNSSGQGKLNYPFQYDTVKLLEQIRDNTGGGGGPTNNGVYVIRETATVSYPAGTLKAISIVNVGNANGSVNGVVLKANEKIGWGADNGETLSTLISVDATGTEFLITAVLP